MSREQFPFRHRPFSAAPNVLNYTPAEAIESTLDAVVSCIRRGAGIAVVIGPSGTGKTMFCHVLAERIQGESEVVMLATARLCTRRALLQNILFELGLPYRDREEGELRLAILDKIKQGSKRKLGITIIVDEAQTMPMRLIEELRLLTNVVKDGKTPVHLVLTGTQSLEERLTSPKVEAINQRIALRSYLYPMTREETKRFIRTQIAQALPAKSQQEVFAESAVSAIYEATEGLPRLVNQVCDHALLLANVRKAPTIERELAEEAWADLQQLPSPWQVSHRSRSGLNEPDANHTVIEFGPLDSLSPKEDFFQDIEAEWNEPATASDSSTAPRVFADEIQVEEKKGLPTLEVAVRSAVSIEPETSANPFADEQFEEEADLVDQVALRAIAKLQDEISSVFNRSIQLPQPAGRALDSKSTDSKLTSGTAAATSSANASSSSTANSVRPARIDLLAAEGIVDVVEPKRTTTTFQLTMKTEVATETLAETKVNIRPAIPTSLSLEKTPITVSSNEVNASVKSAPADDRDILVIEHPTSPSTLRVFSPGSERREARPISKPEGRAFREDYGSLFSRLRGDSSRDGRSS